MIVVLKINDEMKSLAAASSKIPKRAAGGATSPSFNFHPTTVAQGSSPYGLPIVAVPTVGFWLIVGFLAALGLAAAMLAATYQK